MEPAENPTTPPKPRGLGTAILSVAQPPPALPVTGQYRRLLITLGLFDLALFLAILMINYFSSFQIEKDAIAINLAGRQRMLSQRIPLLVLQLPEARGPARAALQKDLQSATELFQVTLNAFESGGTVRGGNLQPVQLDPVSSRQARTLIAETQALWQPFLAALSPSLQSPPSTGAETVPADALVKADRLLVLTNEFTTEVEADSRAQATRLRTYQTTTGLVAIVSFAALIYVFVARVRQSDRSLAEFAQSLQQSNAQLQRTAGVLAIAKQEADLILTTVRQGMLLLDAEFRIGAQYSDELKRLFHTEDLAGLDFRQLLKPLLPERMFNTTCDYLELMFNPAKKERQLAKINPLAQVEVQFPGVEASSATHFLEFNFRRIVLEQRVARLFVSVRDITPQVRLEQRVRVEEAKKERQLEVLLSILHLEPVALEEFLNHARAELDTVAATFRQGDETLAGPDEALREILHGVLAAVHNVKGNAAALELAPFERSAHEFEEEVRSLLHQPRLLQPDLLEIEGRLAAFRAALDEGADLAARLRAFARSEGPGDPISDSIAALVHATALKHGRTVRLEATAFRSSDIPAEHRLLVHDILIQLARNSVVHGIEEPAARVAAGKPPEGVIRLSSRLEHKGQGAVAFRLFLEDDGAGLDYVRIRERAVGLGLTTGTTAGQLSDDETAAFIFEPGFTTAPTETTTSGHGAGLNFVRRRVINEVGGAIGVACEPGRSLRFSIVLPSPRVSPSPASSTP